MIETQAKDLPNTEATKPPSGLFIVLEGIDNCGKTTQSNLLREYLEGRGVPVIQTREPGGTEDGERIRQLLLNRTADNMLDPLTQTLLFYASRREFLTKLVQPALEQGTHVISDRFEASTFVYQGLAQNVNLGFIQELSHRVVSDWGLSPDLYAVIDITVEESRRRQLNADNSQQKLVYEHLDDTFQNQVRNGYLEYIKGSGESKDPFARSWPPHHNGWVFDGMRSVGEIHQDLVGMIERYHLK